MNDISSSYEILECHEMLGLQNVTVYKLYSQRDPRDLNSIWSPRKVTPAALYISIYSKLQVYMAVILKSGYYINFKKINSNRKWTILNRKWTFLKG